MIGERAAFLRSSMRGIVLQLSTVPLPGRRYFLSTPQKVTKKVTAVGTDLLFRRSQAKVSLTQTLKASLNKGKLIRPSLERRTLLVPGRDMLFGRSSLLYVLVAT